jgi:hypothetical protein
MCNNQDLILQATVRKNNDVSIYIIPSRLPAFLLNFTGKVGRREGKLLV